jgi:ABC-type phosphate transport system substrate-binding protein
VLEVVVFIPAVESPLVPPVELDESAWGAVATLSNVVDWVLMAMMLALIACSGGDVLTTAFKGATMNEQPTAPGVAVHVTIGGSTTLQPGVVGAAEH